MGKKLILLISILMTSVVIAATQQDEGLDDEVKSLDGRVQDLKKEVLEINRDLYILEEELLFPANTQMAVFISVDVGDFFDLDSVQLKIDDKEVANYLYTKREVEALHRGGVQQLYLGNVASGEHELIAVFVGKGPSGRDYRRGAHVTIDKGLGAKYLELKISDKEIKHQPEFVIKEWQ
ncbi:MAG: AraC family transcriptional regulator [Pseudomonadota bacterium]